MSKDQKSGSEQEAQFEAAVDDVEGLYMADQLARMLKGDTREVQFQRDSAWIEAEQQYPDYTVKIMQLRTTLKNADKTKAGYPQVVTNAMGAHFLRVENKAARMFLTDVLLARSSDHPGYIGKDVALEATLMATELGAQGGFASDLMRKVTLSKAVGAVLKGELKLSQQRQTPPPTRGRR
ncbi:MAG TPA: hypothetical protein VKT82_28930 [Ktedonobacterales bacterium]|nr:hypothetical protein [Ktedonobacterales bacterium]